MLLNHAAVLADKSLRTMYNYIDRNASLGAYWRCRRTVNEDEFIMHVNRCLSRISLRQCLRFGRCVLGSSDLAVNRYLELAYKSAEECFDLQPIDENECAIHISDVYEILFQAMLLALREDKSNVEIAEEWQYYLEKCVDQLN